MTPTTLADFTDVLFAWVRDNDPRAEMDDGPKSAQITTMWDGVPVIILVWERPA